MQQYYYLRVCSNTPEGGDRIGVYLFADDLSREDISNIIEKNIYNKTALVFSSPEFGYKLNFFNGSREIRLCGNSIIAAYSLMRDKNIIGKGLHFTETSCGTFPVLIDDDMIYIEQPKPKFIKEIKHEDVEQCFKNYHAHDYLKPLVIDNYFNELLLPIKSKDDLYNLIPMNNQITDFSIKHKIDGIHVFSLDQNHNAYTRNFIPRLGIFEEYSSVFLSGSLAYYIYNHVAKKKEYHFKQGHSFNFSADLHAIINERNNKLSTVWVGGNAYILEDIQYILE